MLVFPTESYFFFQITCTKTLIWSQDKQWLKPQTKYSQTQQCLSSLNHLLQTHIETEKQIATNAALLMLNASFLNVHRNTNQMCIKIQIWTQFEKIVHEHQMEYKYGSSFSRSFLLAGLGSLWNKCKIIQHYILLTPMKLIFLIILFSKKAISPRPMHLGLTASGTFILQL